MSKNSKKVSSCIQKKKPTTLSSKVSQPSHSSHFPHLHTRRSDTSKTRARNLTRSPRTYEGYLFPLSIDVVKNETLRSFAVSRPLLRHAKSVEVKTILDDVVEKTKKFFSSSHYASMSQVQAMTTEVNAICAGSVVRTMFMKSLVFSINYISQKWKPAKFYKSWLSVLRTLNSSFSFAYNLRESCFALPDDSSSFTKSSVGDSEKFFMDLQDALSEILEKKGFSDARVDFFVDLLIK